VNERKREHHRFEDPNGEEIHHGDRPYWKCANCDWHIWFCVILMLTGDLQRRIHGQPQQSQQLISAPAGN
jgi:hypothetical protein